MSRNHDPPGMMTITALGMVTLLWTVTILGIVTVLGMLSIIEMSSYVVRLCTVSFYVGIVNKTSLQAKWNRKADRRTNLGIGRHAPPKM